MAFREWKAAGRPRSGPIFEERKNCKRDVSSHLSRCRARIERDSIQKRDERFASNHPQRFRYHSPKSEGTTLLVDGSLVTDQASILATWVDHFSTLGKSLCSSNPSLRSSQSRTALLEAQSYTESDHILDSPFSEEEIQEAILHLKKDSAEVPTCYLPSICFTVAPCSGSGCANSSITPWSLKLSPRPSSWARSLPSIRVREKTPSPRRATGESLSRPF